MSLNEIVYEFKEKDFDVRVRILHKSSPERIINFTFVPKLSEDDAIISGSIHPEGRMLIIGMSSKEKSSDIWKVIDPTKSQKLLCIVNDWFRRIPELSPFADKTFEAKFSIEHLVMSMDYKCAA